MKPGTVTQCRSSNCNAVVTMVLTGSKKLMPIDGEHQGIEFFDPALGHISHFRTCPDASSFRTTKTKIEKPLDKFAHVHPVPPLRDFSKLPEAQREALERVRNQGFKLVSEGWELDKLNQVVSCLVGLDMLHLYGAPTHDLNSRIYPVFKIMLKGKSPAETVDGFLLRTLLNHCHENKWPHLLPAIQNQFSGKKE